MSLREITVGGLVAAILWIMWLVAIVALIRALPRRGRKVHLRMAPQVRGDRVKPGQYLELRRVGWCRVTRLLSVPNSEMIGLEAEDANGSVHFVPIKATGVYAVATEEMD